MTKTKKNQTTTTLTNYIKLPDHVILKEHKPKKRNKW